MNSTKIAWAGMTWNPVTGCTPISPGCLNCYAKRMSGRLAGRFGYPGNEPFLPTFHADKINEPFTVKNPTRVFVCSMGDLFHEMIDFETINRVFDVMCASKCGHHTFLVLTKRPARMNDYVAWLRKPDQSGLNTRRCLDRDGLFKNVWAGATVENQPSLNRAFEVLRFPANLHFLSCEPLLTSVKMIEKMSVYGSQNRLKWIICGGETGQHPRPMHPQWARELRDICTRTNTRFFFKQWGNLVPEYQWPSEFKRTPEWVEKYRDGTIRYDQQPQSLCCHLPCDVFRFRSDQAGDFLDGRQHHEIPSELETYRPRDFAQKG